MAWWFYDYRYKRLVLITLYAVLLTMVVGVAYGYCWNWFAAGPHPADKASFGQMWYAGILITALVAMIGAPIYALVRPVWGQRGR